MKKFLVLICLALGSCMKGERPIDVDVSGFYGTSDLNCPDFMMDKKFIYVSGQRVSYQLVRIKEDFYLQTNRTLLYRNGFSCDIILDKPSMNLPVFFRNGNIIIKMNSSDYKYAIYYEKSPRKKSGI